MRTLAKVVLLAAVVAALTGCGNMNGKWRFESIKPEAEKGQFTLGSMCLMKDGTFKSWATEGGQERVSAGTWKYNHDTQDLTFVADGKERTYKAKLLCPGGTMEVRSEAPGHAWTAMMKREGDCPKGCCDGKCDGKNCDPKNCPMHKDAKKTDAKQKDPAKVNQKTDSGCAKSCAAKGCDPKACPAAQKADAKKPADEPKK